MKMAESHHNVSMTIVDTVVSTARTTMPRKEANAPTERIINILDDVASLEDYCREVDELIAQRYPDDLHLFPRRPSMDHVIAERVRQSLTLEQTRRRRAWARKVSSLGKDHDVDALTMQDIEEAIDAKN
jgi:hypothetical protein